MSLSDEQLAARRCGITGSDISAILGLNPWRRPIDVQLDKLGQGPPRGPETERQRKGNLREPELLAGYAARHDICVRQPGTIIHPDYDWARGTPDGIAYRMMTAEELDLRSDAEAFDSSFRLTFADAIEGVEAKLVGSRAARAWGRPGTDEVPPYVRTQCDWYMFLTGIDRWRVVAEIDIEDHEYLIHRDPELEAGMVACAQTFWQVHCVAGEPLAPDGSDSYTDAIKARFPEDHLDLAWADDRQLDVIEAFRDIKREIATLKKQESALVQQIKLMIGEHAGIEFPTMTRVKAPTQRITWKLARDSVSQDWQAIARAFREVVMERAISSEDKDALAKRLDAIQTKTTKTKEGSRRISVPRTFGKVD